MDTSICFINSHFTAHRGYYYSNTLINVSLQSALSENVARRNEDFSSILNNETFHDYLSPGTQSQFSNVVQSSQAVLLWDKLKEQKKRMNQLIETYSDIEKSVNGTNLAAQNSVAPGIYVLCLLTTYLHVTQLYNNVLDWFIIIIIIISLWCLHQHIHS